MTDRIRQFKKSEGREMMIRGNCMTVVGICRYDLIERIIFHKSTKTLRVFLCTFNAAK